MSENKPTTGLSATGLVKFWPRSQGSVATQPVLDNISFTIPGGSTYGLVGESGSGKSTLALALLRLIPITAGEVIIDGQPIYQLNEVELRTQRREMQIVFQNPQAAMNPRHTIAEIILEPLVLHTLGTAIQRRQQLQNLMEMVGLSKNLTKCYPHQLSGGQQQRVMIARALSCRPGFLIADEPVSALDAPIQAQILNLLRELQRELGFTMLFISHDLAVIQFIADTIGVMYQGQLLEQADNQELFDNPCHPYTENLLAAAGAGRRLQAANKAPHKNHKAETKAVCAYYQNCPVAVNTCLKRAPASTFVNKTAAHWVKCLHYEK